MFRLVCTSDAGLQMSKPDFAANKDLLTVGKGRFFDTLRAEDLRDLELLTRLDVLSPGIVLFGEEEEPHEVFLLLEGRVKLTINSANGKRFLLRIAEPGEIVGLASALAGVPYEMTAETLNLCRIASISRIDFLQFLTRHPHALKSASIMLAGSYNQACSRFRTLGGTPSVPEKLARFLLELSATRGTQTEGRIRVHLSLTHVEIGECIGACRESVSRALRNLRRRGLIALRGAIVTIPDRGSLEMFASAGSASPASPIDSAYSGRPVTRSSAIHQVVA